MEIDVTDKVFIDEQKHQDKIDVFVMCVCGEESKMFTGIYNKETRLFFECPHCGAKLYFRNTDIKGRTKIVQVVDEQHQK